MTRVRLSVIIPGLNQSRLLARTLSDIERQVGEFDFHTEVIYVDGHSTDDTPNVINEFKNKINDFSCILDPGTSASNGSGGKGSAIRAGMIRARGELCMYMDADSSTPISEFNRFLPYLEDGYDAVMGSRYVAEPRETGSSTWRAVGKAAREVSELLLTGRTSSNISRRQQPWLRQFMSRGGNLAFTAVLGIDAADSRCGFKAYNARAVKAIFPYVRIPGFGFEEEVLILARKRRLRMIELPVAWYDNDEDSSVSPLRDSLKSFGEILQIKRNQLCRRY